MPLTKIAKRRRTCRNKALKGNSYLLPWMAVAAARSMNRKHGTAVVAFPCDVCGHWHIGKPAK